MAGKMEPEDAFRLIGNRGQGVKTHSRPANAAEPVADDCSSKPPSEPPRWLRFSVLALAVAVAAGFAGLLTRGAFLLIDQKKTAPRETVQEEPLRVLSEKEVKRRITATLKAFTNATGTEERLQYVAQPEKERAAMKNYYARRSLPDSPLWQIRLVKPVVLDGAQFWVVAYTDVRRAPHYVRMERSGNKFLLQWSSSYGYCEIPWERFIVEQPGDPVQMRCYIRPHTGELPPGLPATDYLGFTVEDKNGLFTGLAVIKRSSGDAPPLAALPPNTRNPVNLQLVYRTQPDGTRQLVIHRLIHFQWHQPTGTGKGAPVVVRE